MCVYDSVVCVYADIWCYVRMYVCLLLLLYVCLIVCMVLYAFRLLYNICDDAVCVDEC